MFRRILLLLVVLSSTNIYAQTYTELIAKGDASVIRENYEEAARIHYTAAIALDSSKSEGYFKRGQAYFFGREDSLALKDYNKALVLDPKNPQIYFMRGQARQELKDLNGAQSDYAMATQIDTNYAAAYVKRGFIFLWQKQIMPAYVMFNIGISKDSNQTEEVYFARGYCLQEQMAYQQALADYSKAIALRPNYTDAYLNSGNCWRMLKEYDKALQCHNKAIEWSPSYAIAYYARGFVYLDKGESDKACADWKKAEQLGDKNAPVYLKKHCK